MGAFLSTKNTAILNTSNNIWENSSTACIANCTSINNNPTVILNNTTVDGPITIDAQCQASASCAMQSQLNAQVDNILQSSARQQIITTELLPITFMISSQHTKNTVQENIVNNITQNMQAMCQATSSTIVNNPTVVGNNSTTGAISIISSNQGANADCTINNLARMTLFNSSQADSDQLNKRSNVFGIIMIAIVAMLIIGVIVVILVIGPEGLSSVVSAAKGSGGDGSGELDSLLGGGGEEGEGGGLMGEAESLAGEGAIP